jgi:hypothetical protein
MEVAMTNASIESAMSLRHRLDTLRSEHRTLDDNITRICHDATHDDLQLRRLRKHKLMVRDRIALIERMLQTDSPA